MSPSASNSMELTVGSSGSQKRSRSSSVICQRSSVNLAPKLPGLVDKKTYAQVCTNAKPDRLRPFLFTDLNKLVEHMYATKNIPEDISILSDAAAAEKVLLHLLGPADASIMQAYADGDLRRNLAHRALASSLHLAMWLRETADISKQRDEAIAHVAGLEERLRRFEKIFVKQEAENEILSLEVDDHCREKEYESKIEILSNELNQQKQATEVMESKCKELEAMHKEKATLLEEAMKQLNDANMLLAEVSEGLGVAREPGAKDPKHFWTVCIHCKVQYQ
uniref:uncharacterized protein LOC101310657 n=1 Tax=Fragaria vesca subsp. vesca TaxID=101020 RepID=UPI0005C8B466|nr:PREDICTED: uncharacterized protein LOC101310657 [Fragaria vesca subsp. vesca]XP_011458162.1 PREDICTED: uncharacterized protein LOC101310657 [Fragaria vesca subsp. vesca]XP_011458163.1 PREDICTED: uncharacterized protein LOC101310657 [Fragaria vesca subsp. vesca]XP_011458164.1 PREDICTED: uncharacterized protein LOC101310657 [Fragaria vesca subsp. vesca]XP_011458165.1 PREDICTED: uncharacterized protein LOC101310657 [Fragaria vesca subsp. vesca]